MRAGDGSSPPSSEARSPLDRMAAAAGWPDDHARAARVAAALVADGLAVGDPGALTLPGTAAASS